jgi:hypothetical protein
VCSAPGLGTKKKTGPAHVAQVSASRTARNDAADVRTGLGCFTTKAPDGRKSGIWRDIPARHKLPLNYPFPPNHPQLILHKISSDQENGTQSVCKCRNLPPWRQGSAGLSGLSLASAVPLEPGCTAKTDASGTFSDLRLSGREYLHTWQAGLQYALLATQRLHW